MLPLMSSLLIFLSVVDKISMTYRFCQWIMSLPPEVELASWSSISDRSILSSNPLCVSEVFSFDKFWTLILLRLNLLRGLGTGSQKSVSLQPFLIAQALKLSSPSTDLLCKKHCHVLPVPSGLRVAGGAWFETWPGHRMFWLTSSWVFLSPD